ncbi:MAG TPA: signal recognition particle-docking protein FtsY, partial [Iamia sp.]
MEILIVLLVVGVVFGIAVALVGPRMRGRGAELEPPAAPRGGPATLGRPTVETPEGEVVVEEQPPLETPSVVAPVRPTFRDRLAKARGTVSGYWGSILSRSAIDGETWEE